MSATPTHQALLAQKLEFLFPNDLDLRGIHVNTKKEANIKHPETGGYLELDVWIPSLNLAFEFQDTYHYMTTWYSQHTLKHIQNYDNLKNYFAKSSGTTLIIVPSWWDGTLVSLTATIAFQRPDLLVSTRFDDPIALNPLMTYNNIYKLPDVGELMRASFPASFDGVEFTSHEWWIGEKYDGIRLLWHPIDLIAYTRNGNSIPLLPSVAGNFPNLFIDGEFWFGRRQFTNTYMLFNNNVGSVSWDYMRVMSFDMPLIHFQSNPFEARYEMLINGIGLDNPLCNVATRVKHVSGNHVKNAMEHIVSDGGEGIVLRQLGSLYSQGRSPTLLKMKTYKEDQEGLIVKVDNESVHLELPDGKIIAVPSHNTEISTPREGDVVTFAYEVHPRTEMPINPVILRTRLDILWEDVLDQFHREKSGVKDSAASVMRSKRADLELTPWTSVKNRRKLLEEYAKFHRFDPFVASNWYIQSKERFMQFKGARRVLAYHKDSLTIALLDLFPEIKFDKLQLRASWHDKETRRNFFENYASVNDFDPLVAENWYSQLQGILSTKGSRELLRNYSSVQEALLDIFPDIGLSFSHLIDSDNQSEFYDRTPSEYNALNVQKECFDRYATINRFDSLQAEGWYSQSKKKIMSYKDLATIINLYYRGSRSNALKNIFPDIGIKSSLFEDIGKLRHLPTQRLVFENFATENNFDPHVPSNWYLQSKSNILAFPGVSSIIRHYQGSLSRALQFIFPEEIEPTKLKIRPFNLLNGRILFEKYAKDHCFDPLDVNAWVSQPKRDLLKYKGLARVLFHYNGNLERALRTLFNKNNVDLFCY